MTPAIVAATILLTVLLLRIGRADVLDRPLGRHEQEALERWPDKKQLLEQTADLVREKNELVRDIAARRAAEEAPRHSEEKYRVLVENANDAIVIAQDGVIKYANPKTEELLGYRADELSRMPFTEIIAPDDRALVVDRYVRRLQGEDVPSRYTFRTIARSGTQLDVEINSVNIPWEGSTPTRSVSCGTEAIKYARSKNCVPAKVGCKRSSTIRRPSYTSRTARDVIC